jgi:hypothetical protein
MTPASVSPAVHGIIDELEARVDELVDGIVERIRADVREERAIDVEELRASAEATLQRALVALRDLRDPGEEELAAARELGRERAGQGLPITALARAHRIGVRQGWLEFLAVASRRGLEPVALNTFYEALWRWADAISDAAIEGHHEAELERARAGR